MRLFIITLFIFFFTSFVFSQSIVPFRSNNKWGYKQGEKVIIEPQFDTAFVFDQSDRVALVGKTKNSPAINSKDNRKELTYQYIDTKNKVLYIKPTESIDSTCDFIVSRNLIHSYSSNHDCFVVSASGKKYLVNKNGKQLTGMYDNIYPSVQKDLFICETKNGQNYVGLIDAKGKQIVPGQYSRIIINQKDSLIICCTAGIKTNGSDDIFNFIGEKKTTSAKHIDYVYKAYTIYKVYTPEISYTIQDNSDKKERILKALWAFYMPNGIMVYKQGKDKYYFYNLKEDKKIPFDGRLYWFFNLNEDEY